MSSLQSKGLSRVFSKTIVQKHQFFGALTAFLRPPQVPRHAGFPRAPVFLPGESQGRGSLVGCHLWGLKSLLQHHSSKASTLRRSAFFTVQLSHPYMTTGKTIPYPWDPPGKNTGLGCHALLQGIFPWPILMVKNPMDRGAWQATVHEVTKSQIQLSD